jgi:type VI secretion system protein VasI
VQTSSIIPTKGTGKWITQIDKNPLDDTKTVTLILQADEGKSSMGDPIYLIIRCMSNKTELYIKWQDYLGLDSVSVTTRIGNAKAETKMWNLSTDSKASFYPGSPILFIKNLMSADKLVAQTTPYGENPIIAIFDIRGLTEAIKLIQETCGWK